MAEPLDFIFGSKSFANPQSTAVPTATPQVQPKPQRSEEREDLYPQFYKLNQPHAKPGPYYTTLHPTEEAQFRSWAKQHNISPDDATYDNRGFWKALQMGDPRAKAGFNPIAGEVHGPDTWKTPFDPSFSNESVYALPTAPRWKGRYLIDQTGKQLFDDQTGMRLDVKH